MQQDSSWQTRYSDRLCSAAAAMKLIKSGFSIFIGSGAGTPGALVSALMDHAQHVSDVHLVHILTAGPALYVDEKYRDKFKLNTFFIGENVRDAVHKGIADYTPIFLSEIPEEFDQGRIPIDVALISVSPPDIRGLCSLGVSVDVVKSAAASAKYVIAQVNTSMPRTLGDSFIHVDDLDALVPVDEPLVQVPPARLDDRLRKLGDHVARLVDDGSTIQFGIGNVPQAVAQFLHQKKNLGVHTEMLSDWIIELIECGAVNGSKKTVNRNKVVASFALGSEKLYQYINDNPLMEFHPTEYVNDPFLIARHDKMVAINVGLEVDLTGQVCADSLGSQFYSGFGGQVDFGRGAARSRGGKSIIAIPSTAKDDTISRIVPTLTQGAGVVTTRAEVHYIVTEWGIAYLHGKSIRERTLALISIAHPKFRKQLIQAAKSLQFIYSDQIESSWDQISYPEELERYQTLRDGSEIFFRPVKPTDEPLLAEMLYSLSGDSLRKRFFTHTQTFPHKDVQQLTNIDYYQNLAVVGVVPGPGGAEQIVAIAQYFNDPMTQKAEVAFVVQDDWQKRGMGSSLLRCLAEAARQREVRALVAKVLPDNRAMLAVFENSGFVTHTTFDGDSYSIELDLQATSQ